MMNKLIIITLLALASVSQAVNGDECKTAKTGNETETLFNSKELSVTLNGSQQTKADDLAGGVGLRYMATKYLGAEVSTSLNDFSGPVIDNTRLEAIARLPLEKYRLALSALAGSEYQYGPNEYQLGTGVQLEYRINKHIGAYCGFRYSFARQDLPVNEQILFGLNLVF